MRSARTDGVAAGGRKTGYRLRAVAWLCLAVLLVSALAGCGKKHRPAPKKPEEKPTSPNVTMTLDKPAWVQPDDQGRPLWDVKATRGSGALATGVAALEDTHCTLYTDGAPAMTATAPHVSADAPRKVLTLEGGVTATTTDGKRSFRSEKVTCRVKEEKRVVIEASGGVKLVLDGTTATSERLITDPRLTEGQLAP